MSKVIYYDRSKQIICWGDMEGCRKYINQMYDISLDNLICEEYYTAERYSSFYEDYEVVKVNGTNVYLTLGQAKMLKDGCQEETRGIKYIEKELENLTELTDVFDEEMINELNYMKEYMQKVYRVHARYNALNLFDNLDMDGLHSAYQMERENKGLPTVFIK